MTNTRYIVTKLHPWLPCLYALIMFLNWSKDMRIWEIEDDFEWTYGQVSCLPFTLALNSGADMDG